MNKSLPKFPLIHVIIKFLVLQAFFITTIRLAPLGYTALMTTIGVTIAIANYWVIKKMIPLKAYILFVIVFYCSGLVYDSLLIKMGILPLAGPTPPLWFPLLWMMFFCYYGDVFNKMLNFPIPINIVLGAVGGSLAYYRGLSSQGVDVDSELIACVALFWAIFTPVTLRLFRNLSIKNLVKN